MRFSPRVSDQHQARDHAVVNQWPKDITTGSSLKNVSAALTSFPESF